MTPWKVYSYAKFSRMTKILFDLGKNSPLTKCPEAKKYRSKFWVEIIAECVENVSNRTQKGLRKLMEANYLVIQRLTLGNLNQTLVLTRKYQSDEWTLGWKISRICPMNQVNLKFNWETCSNFFKNSTYFGFQSNFQIISRV